MGVTITTVGDSLKDDAPRIIDRGPDDRLWVVKKSGATLTFWYSDNDGGTWAQATGNITDASASTSERALLFVDLDGGLNVAYASGGGPAFRRGTVSGTTITWNSPLSLINEVTHLGDLVAFRDPSGSGWRAAIAGRPGSGSENYQWLMVVRIIGTMASVAGAFILNEVNATAGVPFGGSIDFHHTGDGKTVQGGTPHLYAAYSSASTSIVVSRLAWTGNGYSAPLTVVGKTPTIGNTRLVFDGTRLMFIDWDTTADTIRLYERDAGNTSTTDRTTSEALAAGFTGQPMITYDRDGNIHVLAIGASDGDLWRNVWTRATNTWGTWTLVQAATATAVTLRQGWAGADFPTIEGAYRDATNLIYQLVTVVNAVPNPPTVLSPINGSVQDAAASLGITWQFNDPDQGDAQSAYTVRRRIGAVAHSYWNGTSWVASESGTTKIATTTTALTLGPGWGADGDSHHHYSVKTWDSLDQVSPWSSEIRVIPSAKDNPTITDPTPDGVDITTATYTVVWTVASQTKYRVRVVGDTAGTPNLDLVEFDSGIINSLETRSLAVSFPTNSVRRQIELTTWNDEGLASTPVYRIVDVAFTPPATPTIALSTSAVPGAIRVTIDNPAGGAAMGTNDLYRRVVGDTGTGIRVATGLAVDAVVADYAVASGVDYAYRAKAIATTGATAFSSWTA